MLQKSSKHFLISIFFSPSSFCMLLPPPLQTKYLKCVLPIFIIHNIALQNTDYGVLHKSSKHFMISIFFPPVEGDTPSLSHPARYFVFRTMTYFFYNFVVKKCVLSIFIYNVALQNTDFGVLQRERGGGGGESFMNH